MNIHRFTQHYDNAFQTFLAHTDEKELLLDEIRRRITVRKSKSLLDIGAGNGLLSFPLAQLVDRYVAVEAKENYARNLADAGLVVINGVFPISMEGIYDIVLASHSIPRNSQDYQSFLTAAWEKVAENGFLLLITYNDVKSAWTNFLQGCGFPAKNSVVNRLDELVAWLSSALGMVQQSIVTVYVTTTSVDDMLNALSFVYSDGNFRKIQEFFEKKDHIINYLDAFHRKGDVYRFPFDHVFMEITRTYIL